MKILVLGGTRFFGVHTVNKLIAEGHDITVATRGSRGKVFGDAVKYITVDRLSAESMKTAFDGEYYDVVIDKIAYCSNDIARALDVLHCGRYIYMSTTAVYDPKRMNTVEEYYRPEKQQTVWCERPDFIYDEIKRQAENALYGKYAAQSSVAVRYPVVMGTDDYTNRLLFYVEHVMRGVPMHIDNIDDTMEFIESREAGEFMAHLVGCDFAGPVNGASPGAVSLRQIIGYVEEKTGCTAVLSEDGEEAPYNGYPTYTINTDRARSLGFTFSPTESWLYDLLDHYIDLVSRQA